MLVTGIDFETNGLDPDADQVIEVGAVVWDWVEQIPMAMMSRFIETPKPLPPEITDINGITDAMLTKFGENEDDVFIELDRMIAGSSYVLAHFGNDFDKKFYLATWQRIGDEPEHREWIDTACDVPYPKRITTRNLRHLASEHGFLNPFSHRAVFDVLTMLRVASCYNFETILNRSREPMIYVQALVDFKTNQLAKDFSFRWNPDKKIWWKGQKQSDWEAERDAYQFKSQFLAGPPE